MKKRITILFAALALAACSGDDEPTFVPAALTVTPTEGSPAIVSEDGATGAVGFTEAGGSATLIITTNQDTWNHEVEQPGERFTVTRQDDELTISVPENKSSLAYEAKVTVKTGTEENCAVCVLTVTQAPTPDPEISVEPQSVDFPAAGGQTEVAVTTNRQRWTIRMTNNNFVAAKTDGKIIVMARENKTTQPKTGAVIITCGEGEETAEAEIPITQQAAPRISVGVDRTSLEFSSDGGSETVAVTVTNADDWGYQCEAPWLTVSREGDILTVTAPANRSANTPTAEIIVYAGDKNYNYDQRSIVATQQAWENAGALLFELTIPEPDGGTVTALLPIMGLTNCTVDWGDGCGTDHPTQDIPSHEYSAAGVYEVAVKGGVDRINSHASSFTYPHRDAINYITAVLNWGNTDLKSMERAFYNCKNLRRIPGDPDGAFSKVTTFEYAFCKCETLEEIPADLFTNSEVATKFDYCFQDCEAITTIPSGLFTNCTAAEKFYGTFYSCELLTAVPDGLFSGLSNVTTFSRVFGNNPNLETVGRDVFKGCTENTSFNQLFYYCGKLKSVPADIFDDCRKVKDLRFAFRYDSSLTGESPYTVIDGKKIHLYERNDHPEHFTAVEQYNNCFGGCSGLSDYDAIDQAGWR